MYNGLKKREIIEFFGHPSIRATHKTTFEITKELDLTPRGNCIIGVKATKSCIDVDDRVKTEIKKGLPIKIIINVDEYTFEVCAFGHPSLILTDKREIVIRKSNYMCPRTLAIRSDKAAIDLPRFIVSILNNRNTKGRMIISF